MTTQTGISPFQAIPGTMLSALALYSDKITLTASGQGITLDPQKMQNPASRSMLIDEVRFIAEGNVSTIEYGSFLYARFRINRQALTRDYTPVWTLGKIHNFSQGRNSRRVYVYRPPVPIYVPKYSNLQCDLMVDPTAWATNSGNGSFTFSVVYVGRQIEDNRFQPPQEVDVPWVATFVPPVFTPGVQSPTYKSTANDLSAPFREDLHVSSMIGRILYGFGDSFITYPAIVNQLTTIKIMSPTGAIVTRDPTPFGHLFDSITREWGMNTTLSGNSYLIASVTSDQRQLVAFGPPDTNSMLHLTMHGYRTVSLHDYMG